MGSRWSKGLSKEELEFFKENTNYSEQQITAMHKLFRKECPDGRLNQDQFIAFFHRIYPAGKPDIVCQRLFHIFDTDNSGFVDFKEFLLTIYIFSTGAIEATLELIFGAYDVDGNGTIDENEMDKIVQAIHAMPTEDYSDPSQSQATRLFKLMDNNDDKKITRSEFIKFCLADPAIVRSLGKTKKK